MDGRRHSVDLPISKTLIALRRVRSLRDPDTNSLSRLSNFVDNLNWETNSTNGIVLDQVNNCLHEIDTFDSNDYGLFRQSDYHGQNNRKFKKTDQSGLLHTNQAVVHENKSLSERYCNNYSDLPCMMPTIDFLEVAGSCNEQMEVFLEAERRDNNEYKRRSRHKKHYKSSKVVGGDIMSCVSSPCLSISDGSFGGSSSDAPLYESTPGFQEVGVSKHFGSETVPFSESPKCLSQKFRPKLFNELVGQNVVSKSLLSTILNKKIASFYLFHGPPGTGKTSAARIFAAGLNCLSHNEKKPCLDCQECALFFAGRSRDVKEVDSVSINQTENLRYLIKSAMLPPVSSSFKVFIIDECQLINGSTWSTLMNSLDEVCRHVVFIMITPNLSKLPRGVIPMSQRFLFQKINKADIVCRLEKICLEEGFNYDQVALDIIASRCSGSLRDAEMTLEQLSLLGKKITLSLTYEIIGIVSDNELLELLAMALSSDTSNTVKRARELMKSRIDPMQLISQLANLIMDILAGKYEEDPSEVKRQFFGRHNSETDIQQLNNALKILSETEKQLRASKNQTTWLTVALLQLSSVPSFNANDSSFCARSEHPRVSADDSLKHIMPSQCGHNNGCESEKLKDKVALESIWNRATEICNSVSLCNFLRRHGNLVSVCFHQGLAVVELGFQHPNHVSKAEKSWKAIASALQSALGCNVEIRICHSDGKRLNMKKSSFSLFRCGRGNKQCNNQNDTVLSENIKDVSEQMGVKESARTIRNSDGNSLSIDFSGQESVKRSCCFPQSAKVDKKIRSLDTSTTSEAENNLVSKISSPRTCTCTNDNNYVVCGFCKTFTCCNRVERQKKDSKVHCWKSPMFPLKKAWQLRLRHQGV